MCSLRPISVRCPSVILANDLAAAADQQISLRRCVEPLLDVARAIGLELGCLPSRERRDRLPDDARVGSIQAQLPQQQQRHLAEHVGSRVATAAEARDHLQRHRRHESLHLEAAEPPIEIADQIFLRRGRELVDQHSRYRACRCALFQCLVIDAGPATISSSAGFFSILKAKSRSISSNARV